MSDLHSNLLVQLGMPGHAQSNADVKSASSHE